MMNKFIISLGAPLLLLALLFSFVLVKPMLVSAAVDPFPTCRDGASQKVKNSTVCSTPTDTDLLNGSNNLIATIANLVAAVGGIIAVVMVIYYGLQLIMSSGESAKIVQARTGLIYTAAGIVVLVLARTIVYFVQSRL